MVKVVTCIDISSLYQEKKGKAIQLINLLCAVKHNHITHIYGHTVVDERLIYVEMEMPLNTSQWRTFCKRKFSNEEIVDIMYQFTQGVQFLNSLGFVHRDVHPSRIQQFNGNVIKFNPIGLPYNFKKLLKRDNFSGHINYSAPELILE